MRQESERTYMPSSLLCTYLLVLRYLRHIGNMMSTFKRLLKFFSWIDTHKIISLKCLHTFGNYRNYLLLLSNLLIYEICVPSIIMNAWLAYINNYNKHEHNFAQHGPVPIEKLSTRAEIRICSWVQKWTKLLKLQSSLALTCCCNLNIPPSRWIIQS